MYSKLEIQQASFQSLARTAVMIKENLDQSDLWVEKAIVRIYDNQTADEQNSEHTKHDNGIGFSSVDSNILSSFAKQILSNKRGVAWGSRLSRRQTQIGRKLIRKYSRQLAVAVRAGAAAELEARIREDKVQEIEADMAMA